MAKQLTAPGCTYSIVARVDTTIYSPDQKWTLDVSAGQTDFIAETNEIIIPGDAMLRRKTKQHSKDRNRLNLLGTGPGSLATFVTRAIERIVGKGNAKVEYGAGKVTVALVSSATTAQIAIVENLLDRMLPKDVAGEIDPFPIDFEQIEYFETDGTNYIDTLFGGTVAENGTFDDIWELDFCPLVDEGTTGTVNYSIMGWYVATSNNTISANRNMFGYTISSSDLRLLLCENNLGYTRSPVTSIPPNQRHVCLWNQVEKSVTVDGVAYRIQYMQILYPIHGNPENLTMLLGAMKYRSLDGEVSVMTPAKCKYYSCKIRNASGEPIIDLIPVRRKSDDYPGMWCKVRKIFLPMQYATNITNLTDEDWEQLNTMATTEND